MRRKGRLNILAEPKTLSLLVLRDEGFPCGKYTLGSPTKLTDNEIYKGISLAKRKKKGKRKGRKKRKAVENI